MTTKLAIVIPAYKINYLEDCLFSIAQQTNKNFNLYIGDDNCPDDLKPVVEKYVGLIDIHYKKFSENLGSVSLVEQWERCINMTGHEEWIWLFSDDDMMDKNAVQNFFAQEPEPNNVYRFNLNVIDEKGNLIRKVSYPNIESSVSYLNNRLLYKYDSAITAFIFSKKTHNLKNGFVEFPLAWASDDASIIQFAESGQIISIPDANISWRHSGFNISSNFESDILKKKILARYYFVKWLYSEKKEIIVKVRNHKKIVSKWFYHGVEVEYSSASFFDRQRIYKKISKYVGLNLYYLLFKKWKQNLSNKIKRPLKFILYYSSSK